MTSKHKPNPVIFIILVTLKAKFDISFFNSIGERPAEILTLFNIVWITLFIVQNY